MKGKSKATTSSSRWYANGEKDPHDNRYDCERAKLISGHQTDDELANTVFMQPNMNNLTAAKDRIRWLSRKLNEKELNTEPVSNSYKLPTDRQKALDALNNSLTGDDDERSCFVNDFYETIRKCLSQPEPEAFYLEDIVIKNCLIEERELFRGFLRDVFLDHPNGIIIKVENPDLPKPVKSI